MNRAWDEGINYFDTADSYGGGVSETVVGAWLRERKGRDQLILSTKVGYAVPGGPNDTGLSRRHLMQAIDGSLRRLQTDHVDLYVTMEPAPTPPIDETVATIRRMIKTG